LPYPGVTGEQTTLTWITTHPTQPHHTTPLLSRPDV
jgi:hypothetical protein